MRNDTKSIHSAKHTQNHLLLRWSLRSRWGNVRELPRFSQNAQMQNMVCKTLCSIAIHTPLQLVKFLLGNGAAWMYSTVFAFKQALRWLHNSPIHRLDGFCHHMPHLKRKWKFSYCFFTSMYNMFNKNTGEVISLFWYLYGGVLPSIKIHLKATVIKKPHLNYKNYCI